MKVNNRIFNGNIQKLEEKYILKEQKGKGEMVWKSIILKKM